MNSQTTIKLDNEAASERWATQISQCLVAPCVIGLTGELGAGKTTLVRAVLRALGIQGAIKSPTYALVESYDHQKGPIHHFDLYRIAHEDELALIGFRDYLTEDALCFIEWPAKTQTSQSVLDVLIDISFQGSGRMVKVSAYNKRGNALITCLQAQS